MNRNAVAQIDTLDREFYKHVAKNRVDAALQSATNPVPDYYGEPYGSLLASLLTARPGEKIGSLKQYRQVKTAVPPSIRRV
jgi:hypothetical protein